jgi:hypothetical protein
MNPVPAQTPFRWLLEMLLLRARPQDLPASRLWVGLALSANALADGLALLDQMPAVAALQVAVLDTLLLVVFVLALLAWRGFNTRALQTLTALAGIGALFSLMAWSGTGLVAGEEGRAVVVSLILLWYLAVAGHVLRHALEIPWLAGVALSFLYFVLSTGLIGLLFGKLMVPET